MDPITIFPWSCVDDRHQQQEPKFSIGFGSMMFALVMMATLTDSHNLLASQGGVKNLGCRNLLLQHEYYQLKLMTSGQLTLQRLIFF